MTIKTLSTFLFTVLIATSCTPAAEDQTATIAELEEQLTQAQAEVATLKAETHIPPGLIHSVFFWLKEDLTAEQQAAFRAGVESLRGVNAIQEMYVGPVAPTEARAVVDNSYSLALIVHFADVAGQDAYQIDPIHLKFVEDHKDKWTKVVIYDNSVE